MKNVPPSSETSQIAEAQTSGARARRPSRRAHLDGNLAILLLILVGGGALRFLGLGHRELWHDEYCSLLYATAPEGTIAALRAGGNPPLYFLLLHGWTSLFGVGEGAVRALSALASVLSLGALALWLRSVGLPRRAVLWAAAIGALTPLHLFYAREARGYSLMLLVLCGTLWVFTEALRRRSIRWWALYALLLAVGFYTHNLLVPLAVLHWPVAWLLRADRRAWLSMLAAQGLALAAYAPWTLVLTQQPYSQQAQWIVEYWRKYPPVLAIPRTLLSFGLGGAIPSYIAWATPATAIAVLSGVWSATALVFAFSGDRSVRAERHRASPESKTFARGTASRGAAKTRKGPDNTRPESAFREPHRSDRGRQLAVIVVLMLAPLVVLWLASALVRPVYIVGRYDLAALPPYLGLMGLGVDAFQNALRRIHPGAAWALPLAISAVLFVGGVLPRYRQDLAPAKHFNEDRAGLLARHVGRDDLLISVDLAASSVLFHVRTKKIAVDHATFPREILEHWGWFNAEESLRRGRAELLAEAESLIADHERTHHGAGRIWILPHVKVLNRPGDRRPNPHQELYDILLEACRRQRLVLSYPEGPPSETFSRLWILPLRHGP